MPESPFEQFAQQQPHFGQSFDAIAEAGARIIAKSQRFEAVSDQLRRLSKAQKSLQTRRDSHIASLRESIADNEDLDDISFIAATYATNVIEHQPLRASPERLAVQFQDSFTHVHSSIHAARRILARPEEPILYFEVLGGETHYGLHGLEKRPEVSRQFTALSLGDGLDIRTDRSSRYRSSTALFSVTDAVPESGPQNFVIGGYINKGEYADMTIRQLTRLIGTATFANVVLNGSIYSLQTNAVFVGEHAVNAANRFIDRTETMRAKIT